MKREIKNVKLGRHFGGCCPGHDTYPDDSYANGRSKEARSRDKKKEHRHARRVLNRMALQEFQSYQQGE